MVEDASDETSDGDFITTSNQDEEDELIELLVPSSIGPLLRVHRDLDLQSTGLLDTISNQDDDECCELLSHLLGPQYEWVDE